MPDLETLLKSEYQNELIKNEFTVDGMILRYFNSHIPRNNISDIEAFASSLFGSLKENFTEYARTSAFIRQIEGELEGKSAKEDCKFTSKPEYPNIYSMSDREFSEMQPSMIEEYKLNLEIQESRIIKILTALIILTRSSQSDNESGMFNSCAVNPSASGVSSVNGNTFSKFSLISKEFSQ